MSEKKVLLKERVLTAGRGYRRAVLCYESGLVYQYDEPENVLAQFVPSLKAWVQLKTPYYHQGAYGSSSSGDGDGAHLMYSAGSLLNSIQASQYILNQSAWITNKAVKEYNTKVAKQNKLVKQMSEKFSQNMDEYPLLKLIELEPYAIEKTKQRGIDVFQLIEKMNFGLKVFLSGKGREIKIQDYTFNTWQVKQGALTVAFRNLSGDIVMNSQVIRLTQFERDFLGSESIVQNEIKKVAKVSIPFNVLESAKLKLNQTKIIEQGPEQTFTIRKDTYSQNTETRHFTGYLLLENAGRKFFMDIDRLEIEHKIFNVFFVEVDKSVKTAMQAYESMKPEIVRDAENAGLKVLRQGEWFFIPTNEKIRMPIKNIYNRILRDNFPYPTIQQFNISHGKGRPNSLFKVVIDGIEGSLVCGMVRHLGREHNPLKLGYRYVNPELENNTIDQFDQGYSHAGSEEIIEVDLFTVVGNTTVSNFTVTGDVD